MSNDRHYFLLEDRGAGYEAIVDDNKTVRCIKPIST